jgi:hypothetical protein
VQRRCASGGPVIITAGDGRRINAACATPLADPPPDYLVKRWRREEHQPLGWK